MTDESPRAVATRGDVAMIVKEVRDLWISDEGPANVTCVYDINSGPCSDFAGEVVDVVLERFPGTEIDVEDYEDHLNANGYTAQGIHYYVKLGDWYFDASETDGVASPDYLPTCRSIRICASSVDDDGEDFEEDDAVDHDDEQPNVPAV